MRAHVFKNGRDWHAMFNGQIVTCSDWHDAMQMAWGMVMFP